MIYSEIILFIPVWDITFGRPLSLSLMLICTCTRSFSFDENL